MYNVVLLTKSVELFGVWWCPLPSRSNNDVTDDVTRRFNNNIIYVHRETAINKTLAVIVGLIMVRHFRFMYDIRNVSN